MIVSLTKKNHLIIYTTVTDQMATENTSKLILRSSNGLTKIQDLLLFGFDLFLVFDRCKSQVPCTLYFEMAIEVLYAADNPLALKHIGTCPESYGM